MLWSRNLFSSLVPLCFARRSAPRCWSRNRPISRSSRTSLRNRNSRINHSSRNRIAAADKFPAGNKPASRKARWSGMRPSIARLVRRWRMCARTLLSRRNRSTSRFTRFASRQNKGWKHWPHPNNDRRSFPAGKNAVCGVRLRANFARLPVAANCRMAERIPTIRPTRRSRKTGVGIHRRIRRHNKISRRTETQVLAAANRIRRFAPRGRTQC